MTMRKIFCSLRKFSAWRSGTGVPPVPLFPGKTLGRFSVFPRIVFAPDWCQGVAVIMTFLLWSLFIVVWVRAAWATGPLSFRLAPIRSGRRPAHLLGRGVRVSSHFRNFSRNV